MSALHASTTAGAMPKASLALVFALAASAASVGLFLGSKEMVVGLLGFIGLVVCFALSGNQRLFCLWGLALSAPLGLSKSFYISSHMGGASAVTIDLVDIFILPLVVFILRDRLAGRRLRLVVPPVLYWWGAMMLLGVADVVIGPLRQLALLEVVRMAKSALLFLVVANELVRVRQMLHYVAAITVGIAMQSVFALVQYTFKANLGLQFLGEPVAEATDTATKSVYLGTSDAFRAGGLFSHPNLLAGYLALLLPICIALVFSRTAPLSKALLSGTIALGLGALVITLSRSGWMSFATAFALLFLSSMLHQRLRLRYILARLLVIGGILGAAALASGEILRRINNSDPGALKFRFEMMDTAWTMIADHPIFGLGLNTFVAYFPLYAPRPGPSQVTADYGAAWPVVHDSYLITWTQQGTVGFVCLCMVYLAILWMGVRTGRYFLNDYVYALNLGACCGIVAIMVDGIGSFFIDENAGQRVFWMVAALIVAAHEWTRANRHPPRYLLRQSDPARAPAAMGPPEGRHQAGGAPEGVPGGATAGSGSAT